MFSQTDEREGKRPAADRATSSARIVAPPLETFGQLLEFALGASTAADLPTGAFQDAVRGVWTKKYTELSKVEFDKISAALTSDVNITLKPILIKIFEDVAKKKTFPFIADDIAWATQHSLVHHVKNNLKPAEAGQENKATPLNVTKDITTFLQTPEILTANTIATQYFKDATQKDVSGLLSLLTRITKRLADDDQALSIPSGQEDPRVEELKRVKQALEAKNIHHEYKQLKDTRPQRLTQLGKNLAQLFGEGYAGMIAKNMNEFLTYCSDFNIPDWSPGMLGCLRGFMGVDLSSKDVPTIAQLDQLRRFLLESTNMGLWTLEDRVLSEEETKEQKKLENPVTLKAMLDVTPCDDIKAAETRRKFFDHCTPEIKSNSITKQAGPNTGFGRKIEATIVESTTEERRAVISDTLNGRMSEPAMRFMEDGECILAISTMGKGYFDIYGLNLDGKTSEYNNRILNDGHVTMTHSGDIPKHCTSLAQMLGLELYSGHGYQLALLDPGDPSYSAGSTEPKSHVAVMMGSWENTIQKGLGAFKFIPVKFTSPRQKELVLEMLTSHNFQSQDHLKALEEAVKNRKPVCYAPNVDAFEEAKAYGICECSVATVNGKNVFLGWYQPVAFKTQAGASEELKKFLEHDLNGYLKSEMFKQRFNRMSSARSTTAPTKPLTGSELYSVYSKYLAVCKALLQDPSPANRQAYDKIYEQLHVYFPLFKLSDYSNPLRAVCDVMQVSPELLRYIDVTSKLTTGLNERPATSPLLLSQILGQLSALVVAGATASDAEIRAATAALAKSTAALAKTEEKKPTVARSRYRVREAAPAADPVALAAQLAMMAAMPKSDITIPPRADDASNFFYDPAKNKGEGFVFPPSYADPQATASASINATAPAYDLPAVTPVVRPTHATPSVSASAPSQPDFRAPSAAPKVSAAQQPATLSVSVSASAPTASDSKPKGFLEKVRGAYRGQTKKAQQPVPVAPASVSATPPAAPASASNPTSSAATSDASLFGKTKRDAYRGKTKKAPPATEIKKKDSGLSGP